MVNEFIKIAILAAVWFGILCMYKGVDTLARKFCNKKDVVETKDRNHILAILFKHPIKKPFSATDFDYLISKWGVSNDFEEYLQLIEGKETHKNWNEWWNWPAKIKRAVRKIKKNFTRLQKH